MAYSSSANYATMADLASRMDEKGGIAKIAEILSTEKPILQYLKFMECNMTEGHKHNVRTGLPDVTWRRMYKGVQPSKSTVASMIDTTGNLEAYAEVDKDLADINGNTAAFRLSEDRAFLERMSQEMETTILYGDVSKSPDKFTGIAARYSSKKAANARNLICCNDTPSGKVTSCYFLSFTEKTLSGIYPKGSKVGLQRTDKGQVTLRDENGHPFEGYQTHYKWQAGVTLSDWRGCSRLANIEVTKLMDPASDYFTKGILLQKLMEAKNAIKPEYKSSCRLFVPQDVANALEVIALEKSNNALSIKEAAGQFKTYFFEFPVEICDSISLDETVIK